MKKITLATITIIALIMILLNRKEQKSHKIQSYSLGTIVNIEAWGKNSQEALKQSIKTIQSIEKDITEENFNSHQVMTIVKKAIYYSKLSKGAYDPTIGPIVKLWSIGKEGERIPTEEEIRTALALVDYKKLSTDGDILKKGPSQIVDLGGIAKGYCADQVVAELKSFGIEKAIIDLGGNIFVMGERKRGTPWKIGIQNPYEPRGDYMAILKVKNRSIVTSGIYERYFEREGRRYHHIMDPSTGRPARKGVSSVTIVSEKSIDGDALSTAVFVLGLENGMALVESLPGIEAAIVSSHDIYLSSGMDNFQLKDNNFETHKNN